MTKRPWEAERLISDALAQSLIENQFPQLTPVKVSTFGEGWDNAVFRVNDAYIFRFPRRKIAVPLIERENRILPRIASKLPLPVPIPIFLGEPSGDYPWPFAGYRMLPGQPAYTVGLDEVARIRCAKPLALFLKVLHQIPVEEVTHCGIPNDTIGRLDVEKRLPMGLQTLQTLTQDGVLKDPAPIEATLRNSAVPYTPSVLSLVHGDLHVRNMLLDKTGTLTGIIDWGDVHLNDSAVDFAIVQSFLPPQGWHVFRDAYGNIEEDAWRLATFRALYLSLILLSYGHGIEDQLQVKEAKRAINILVNHQGLNTG